MLRFVTITPTARLTILAVLIASAAMNLAALLSVVWTHPSLNSDFMAFWSFPRFVQHHKLADIYNADLLVAFQQTLYPGFHSFYPYLYPPTLLLVTGWLAYFSFAAAQLLWTILGLCLLLAAIVAFFPPPWRWWAGFAMLASPASLLNWMTGETAYFTTALLLFGFAALPKRPLLAGIAFGLLTLKPQLGVLVPFALLARGEFRAILAAALTALALIAWSCVEFSPGAWPVWMHTLPSYQSEYFTGAGLNLNILVTPAANLIVLGLKPGPSWIIQSAVSVLVAGTVFFCFRRAPYRLAVAALLVGSFLAVPHAYAYDSIAIVAALTLISTALPAFGPGFLALGAVLYLGPYLLLSPVYHWFLYALPEILAFGWIVGLALGKTKRAIGNREPELYHSGA